MRNFLALLQKNTIFGTKSEKMKYLLCLILLVVKSMGVEAQKKNASYEQYIKQYNVLAVQHQKRYRIPASITLAQGILESGAGQSKLAKSNNHFGIKCGSSWKGKKVYHDDDKRNECFRAYNSVEDSYEDHSQFLANGPRYTALFKLNPTDYRGWAKGLQTSGYATDKAYANSLIKIIEDYELYLFDSSKASTSSTSKKKQEKKEEKPKKLTQEQKKLQENPNRPVQNSQGLRYVYVTDNDNLERIAKDTGFTSQELMKFNEIPDDFPLQKGDKIYLSKKKSKADKPYYDYVVQIGESMHSISQKYGMKIRSLYKLNKKKEDYVPTEGDVLKLR
jgi:LysM repeat protein